MKDPRFITRHSLRVNAPLRALTAIRTGGNADFLAEVFTEKKLATLLKDAATNGVKAMVLGSGSRTVFIATSGFGGPCY